jgi:hypothetical protein
MKYLFFGALAVALAGITYSIAPDITHYAKISTM